MKNRNGFTIIEMIMVIILIGIISSVIAVPLMQGAKGWFQATSREGISQSGRIGIERMTREIRNMARTAANAPCISVADAASFIFSDISGNLTACADTNFSRAGAGIPYTIQRNAVDLVNNVQSLDINYYDGFNTKLLPRPLTAAQITTIRRLSIEIVSTKGGETLRKYSEVYLSNMRGY